MLGSVSNVTRHFPNRVQTRRIVGTTMKIKKLYRLCNTWMTCVYKRRYILHSNELLKAAPFKRTLWIIVFKLFSSERYQVALRVEWKSLVNVKAYTHNVLWSFNNKHRSYYARALGPVTADSFRFLCILARGSFQVRLKTKYAREFFVCGISTLVKTSV